MRRLAPVLCLATVTGLASGEVLRHDFKFQPQPLVWGNYSFTLPTGVPRFDSSLGTLQQATVYLDQWRDTRVYAYNESATDYAKVTVNFTWQTQATFGAVTPIVHDFSSSNLAPLPAGGRFDVSEVVGYVRTTVFTDAAELSAFSTPGGALPITISGTLGLASRPKSAFTKVDVQKNTLNMSGYVSYQYAPVPEPMTLAGFGLPALFACRRLRRARS